jgi:4-hydroxybutyrate CoA-transferase
MGMGAAPYQACQNLKISTFFPGGSLRKAFEEGNIAPLRYPLSEAPLLFLRNELRANILLLQVSPADHNGFHSLGLSVDYMPAVLKQNPLVIAEINTQMPRTIGSNFVHSNDIDWYLDSNYTPATVSPAKQQLAEQKIAKNIASLIENGDTLQLGIGALPDATVALLTDRKNLGLHSGILSDAVQPLIEKGIVSHSRNGRWKGASVTTMAAGSSDFYKFLNNNDAIEFHPCALTHSPDTLYRIRRLTAINSALQIDLAGTATAESIGGRRISLPGGLADFATAAAQAPQGKSILALRATNRDGTESNILPQLPNGTIRSLNANQIDYLVTEFGIADLSSRNLTKISKAIADVSAPEHRESLLQSAFRMGK